MTVQRRRNKAYRLHTAEIIETVFNRARKGQTTQADLDDLSEAIRVGLPDFVRCIETGRMGRVGFALTGAACNLDIASTEVRDPEIETSRDAIYRWFALMLSGCKEETLSLNYREVPSA